jgi:hypothetical protein
MLLRSWRILPGQLYAESNCLAESVMPEIFEPVSETASSIK